MAKYKLSKWFNNGMDHVLCFRDSETLLFYRHGRSNGSARFIPHVKRYTRNDIEHASLAALLRCVAAETHAR